MHGRPTRLVLVMLAGLLSMLAVQAVEVPKPTIAVRGYSDFSSTGLAGVDFSTATTGIETQSWAGRYDFVPSTPAGWVSLDLTSRVRFNNAAGGAGGVLAEFGVPLTHDGIPDPNAAPGGDAYFYFGSADTLLGEQGSGNIDADAFEGPFGYGIAQGSTNSRVLVIGRSLLGAFTNNANGYQEFGTFKLFALNPAGGRLWVKEWPVIDPNDWELLWGDCAVGDFLGNDGVDELRIMYDKELQNGESTRTQYFSIDTGALLATRFSTVAAP